MADKEFPEPGFEPMDERASLEAWLDYHRGVAVWKLEGVSEEDARRPMVPSGTSMLGLVKHLAGVERWWFPIVFAGLDVADQDDDWVFTDDDTVAQVIDTYRFECARSREISRAAASLDEMARHPERPAPLRWIMVHMIEETARHNGHLDILRETIDGTTGD